MDDITLDYILKNENSFFTQLEDDISFLTPHIDKFSNKSFNKNLTRLNSYICELKQYDILVANSQGDVVDVDFFSAFNNYIESSALGVNRKDRLKIKFFVDGIPISHNMLTNDDSLKSKFTVQYCLPCMNLVPTQIVDNAFKYAPANTCIEISAQEDPYFKKIVVRNMGPEIGPEEMKNLFKPNYRGRYAETTGANGNGLGLSLVKSVIDTHKWLHAELKVDQSVRKFMCNNIPYTEFSISFIFNQNKIESKSVSQYTSEINNNLMQYILHEYIRIAPHICKLGLDLFRQSLAKDTDDVEDIDGLREKFYDIKDTIFSNILFYRKIDTNFFVRDAPYDNCAKAFSKRLISEVQYVNKLYNKQIIITSNNRHFTFEMYPPMIDIFIHEFSKLIIHSLCKGEALDFRCDTDGIEIASINGFDINERNLTILKEIMNLHNMNIVINNSVIDISRR